MVTILREKNEEGMRYLASRIINCIGPTITGEKPATIMSFSNNGNGLLNLWDNYGREMFQNEGLGHYESAHSLAPSTKKARITRFSNDSERLSYYEMRRADEGAVILFFHRESLRRFLEQEEIREFLSWLGYRMDQSLEEILSELERRFNSLPFPHEIGIFLGIPLKDVKGFMGLISFPCVQTNRWKIYGNPGISLKIAEGYKEARERIEKRLFLEDPLAIINGKGLLKNEG
ncbi:DUF3793 family protein [bacterium]|nr:DUF3793 family protein [bacterium]